MFKRLIHAVCKYMHAYTDLVRKILLLLLVPLEVGSRAIEANARVKRRAIAVAQDLSWWFVVSITGRGRSCSRPLLYDDRSKSSRRSIYLHVKDIVVHWAFTGHNLGVNDKLVEWLRYPFKSHIQFKWIYVRIF